MTVYVCVCVSVCEGESVLYGVCVCEGESVLYGVCVYVGWCITREIERGVSDT